MRVNLEWKEAGCCCHPEFVTIKGGSLASVPFPSNFAKIKHPTEGWILYDTGYSPHFFEETRPFPERLYAWTTPVQFKKSAADIMRDDGIDPADVRWILISHFHGDHVAGLRDFPNARFMCLEQGYRKLVAQSRVRNVSQGYLQKLLPLDFDSRVVFPSRVVDLDDKWKPFDRAYDLFGDGSLLALPLPGHACGQMGLILRTEGDRDVLLAADSVWHTESIRNLRFPHFITRLVHQDYAQYRKTIVSLHELMTRSPEVAIVPTHCREYPEGSLK